jgi:hypothetical protein
MIHALNHQTFQMQDEVFLIWRLESDFFEITLSERKTVDLRGMYGPIGWS